MRRLFEGGVYSSNYCNWQLKSLLHLGQIVITFRTLLHLGQNVITFRTLLHLGSFITFRPSACRTSGRGRPGMQGKTRVRKSTLKTWNSEKLNWLFPAILLLFLETFQDAISPKEIELFQKFYHVTLFQNYLFCHSLKFKFCCQSCDVIFPSKNVKIEKQKNIIFWEYKVRFYHPAKFDLKRMKKAKVASPT